MKIDKINPKVIRAGVEASRGPAKIVEGIATTGATIYTPKGKVKELVVPGENNARGRTIRLHELLHANFSKGCQGQAKNYKVHELTAQAVEDSFVHYVYWPKGLPVASGRDALAVGLQDLRALVADAKEIQAPEGYPVFNSALGIALRSLAILANAGPGIGLRRTRMEYFDGLMASIFGPAQGELARALKLVLGLVQRGKRKQALEAFDSLLRWPKGEEQREEEHGGKEPGQEGDGEQTERPMVIRRLPLLEACDGEQVAAHMARSGMRINVSRLPGVLATRNPLGLFEREQVREPQGTVLIDASGSMQVTAKRLSALCKKAPGAKVAFYHGGGLGCIEGEPGAYGELVVFAENGQRAQGLKGLRSLRGNCVDFWALRWLLDQEPPLVLVSDGQFCGGPKGQAVKASVLLAGNRDRIEVLSTIEQAESRFCG